MPNLKLSGPWELGSCVPARLAFGIVGYRLPRYSENCGPDREAQSQGLTAGTWAQGGWAASDLEDGPGGPDLLLDPGLQGDRDPPHMLRGTRLPDPLGVQVVASSSAMLSVLGPQG